MSENYPSGADLPPLFFLFPSIDLANSHYKTSKTKNAKDGPLLCPGELGEKPRIVTVSSAPNT